MKKVKATIEMGLTGEYKYSIYMDSTGLNYGVNGIGCTVNEAKEDFIEAYEEIRRTFQEEGKDFTEVEFLYNYDVASFLEYYAYAFSLAGLGRITGINQRQLSHYLNGSSKPSRKTVKRIEQKIREFGKDISDIRLC